MRESSLSCAMKQDYTKGCKPRHHDIVFIVFLKFTPHFCAFTFSVRISLLDFVPDLLDFLREAHWFTLTLTLNIPFSPKSPWPYGWTPPHSAPSHASA